MMMRAPTCQELTSSTSAAYISSIGTLSGPVQKVQPTLILLVLLHGYSRLVDSQT